MFSIKKKRHRVHLKQETHSRLSRNTKRTIVEHECKDQIEVIRRNDTLRSLQVKRNILSIKVILTSYLRHLGVCTLVSFHTGFVYRSTQWGFHVGSHFRRNVYQVNPYTSVPYFYVPAPHFVPSSLLGMFLDKGSTGRYWGRFPVE